MSEPEYGGVIVIAEDDDAAAQLIKTNLGRSGFEGDIHRVRNGEQLLRMFAGERVEGIDLCPCRMVLLLDVRMPKVDGIQVLQKLKESERFRKVPVFMLTTSDRPVEVDACHQLGCNAYIRKQVDYKKFVESIKTIADFIKTCEIPVIEIQTTGQP